MSATGLSVFPLNHFGRFQGSNSPHRQHPTSQHVQHSQMSSFTSYSSRLLQEGDNHGQPTAQRQHVLHHPENGESMVRWEDCRESSGSFVSNPSPLTMSAATTPRGETPTTPSAGPVWAPPPHASHASEPTSILLHRSIPDGSAADAIGLSPHRAMQRWLLMQPLDDDCTSSSTSSGEGSTGEDALTSITDSSSPSSSCSHESVAYGRSARIDVLRDSDTDSDDNLHSSEYTSDEIEDLCHDEEMLHLIATAATALLNNKVGGPPVDLTTLFGEGSTLLSRLPTGADVSTGSPLLPTTVSSGIPSSEAPVASLAADCSVETTVTGSQPRPPRFGCGAAAKSVVSNRPEAAHYRTCAPRKALHHVDPRSPPSSRFNLHTEGLAPTGDGARSPMTETSSSRQRGDAENQSRSLPTQPTSISPLAKGASVATPNLNSRLVSPRRTAASFEAKSSPAIRELLGRYRDLKRDCGEQWREAALASESCEFMPELDRIHAAFATRASSLAAKARRKHEKGSTRPPRVSDGDEAEDDEAIDEEPTDMVDVVGAACGRLYSLHDASVQRYRGRMEAARMEEETLLRSTRVVPHGPNERQLRLYKLSQAQQALQAKAATRSPSSNTPKINPRSRKMASGVYKSNRHCSPSSVATPQETNQVDRLGSFEPGDGHKPSSHLCGDGSLSHKGSSVAFKRSLSSAGDRLYTDALRRERCSIGATHPRKWKRHAYRIASCQT